MVHGGIDNEMSAVLGAELLKRMSDIGEQSSLLHRLVESTFERLETLSGFDRPQVSSLEDVSLLKR